jgi:septum site-determining protein MinC
MPEQTRDDNIVVFKGRKNGLIVDCCPDSPFAEIMGAMERKAKNASRFFGKEEMAVTFKGREFSDDELDRLLLVFRQSTDLNITYSGIEREIKIIPPKPVIEEPALTLIPLETPAPAANTPGTKYMEASLRSGQKEEFDGSIVLWGDVNPGAEIIAAGHIIVLGALRGMVWAGCGGDITASVTAAIMQPTQLRIAGEVRLYHNEAYVKARSAPRPMRAFIKDESIHVTEIV